MVYSNISKYYDEWSSGNKYYDVSAKFYVDEAKKYSSTIVELGIGTGRIAEKILENSENHIIGIDSCSEMLKCAEKRLKKSYNDRITLKMQDFRELSLPFRCEYIYMPFRTFGHLENSRDRKKTLKAIRENLLDGGTFIFDHYILDRDWADSVDNKEIVMYEDDDIRITDEYAFFYDEEKMHCTTRCNDIILESFDFYWFDVESIEKIITEVGFKVKDLYGDFYKSKFNKNSVNQIWVLEK